MTLIMRGVEQLSKMNKCRSYWNPTGTIKLFFGRTITPARKRCQTFLNPSLTCLDSYRAGW
jgi:hypothetical protein